MPSKNSVATISVTLVASMFVVGFAEVQKGIPVNDVDLIPSVQLSTGTVGSTGIIAYHPDTITGAEYLAAPHTKPLPYDGLTFSQAASNGINAGRIPPRFLL